MSTFKSGSARVTVEKLSWAKHLHTSVKVGRDLRWGGVINNSDVSVYMSHGQSRYRAAARLALEAARRERAISSDEIEVDEYRQPVVASVSKRKTR